MGFISRLFGAPFGDPSRDPLKGSNKAYQIFHFSYLLICSGLLIIDRITSEQVLRIRLPQYGDRVCWVAYNRLLIPKIAHGICGNSSYGSKINYGKDPPA